MYIIIYLLTLITFCSSESCVFSHNNNNNNEDFMTISGNGLHRTVEINANLQAKVRQSKCNLLYKINLPERVSVDTRQLEDNSPNHDLVFIYSKDDYLTTIYATRKKMFLSTFDLKDTFTFDIQIDNPRKGIPTEVVLEEPIIAFDCERTTHKNCPKLSIDANVKPIYEKWRTISKTTEITKLDVFRQKWFGEFKYYSICLCTFLVFGSTIYLSF